MKDKQSSDHRGSKRSAARRQHKPDDAGTPPADASEPPAPKRPRATAAGRKRAASRKGASDVDLKARIEALERDLAQTRKAMHESIEQCRFLFHDSLMINVIIGLDGKVLDLNDRASESIGYSREELIGIDTAEMFAPECREFAEALLGKDLRGEPTEQAELTLIGKTGPRTYIFTAGQVPIHQNGKLIGMLVSGVDITERRRAEEARHESQERYRTLIENLPVGLGRITPEEDGRFIMVNPAMVRMFGYASVEEFVQKSVSELYQDSPDWDAFRQKLRTDCRVVGMEMHLRRRDGTSWWASVTVNGVCGPTGRVEYWDGMVEDITERKRTEKALRNSERRLQLILQCSTDGINIAELDTRTGKRRLVLCNDRYLEMAGRSREDMFAAEDLDELLCPSPPEQVKEDLGRMMRGEPFAGVTSWHRPDGLENHFEWRASAMRKDEHHFSVIGVDRDVTQRLQTEEALRRWEEDTRQLLDGLEGFLWTAKARQPWEWDMQIPSAKGFERVTGYTREEAFCATGHSFNGITVAEDIPAKDEAGRRALVGEIDGYYQEFRIRHKSGQIRWLCESVRVASRDESGVRFIGACLDITHRKQAEEALRKWEEDTRQLLDGLEGFLWTAKARQPWEWDMQIPSAKGFQRVTGYMPDEIIKITGRIINGITVPEDLSVKDVGGKRALAGEIDGYYHEYRIRHKSGQIRWLGESVRVASRGEDGMRFIGACLDITHRKQAEEALRKWEEDTRQLLDGLEGFLWTADARPGITNWDMQIPSIKGFERVTGYKPEETIQTTKRFINGITLPEDIPGKDQAGKRAVAGEIEGYCQEYRIRHKNGQVRWLCESVRVASRTESGVRFIGACLDITQRKQAEEALRASEERFRTIFDAASDAFFVLDFDGRIIEANAHASKMYGHSHEEFIDLSIRTLTHGSHQRLIDQLLKGMHARHEFHAEAVNVRKDARLINVDLRATVVDFRGDRHILLTLHDITERKQAEKMMQALHRQLITAREKERSRLARELHDSIGQSLVAMRLAMQTTISGANHCMDEPMLSTLTAAADKCNSLIGEVRTICHGLYPPALESLGLLAALRGLARECQSQVQVSVECLEPMESTRFPSEVEIELFRIAQEAASNALRHSHARQILLSLVYEDGQAVLTIADNGAGFDPDKTLDAGMGLNTMRDRAQTVGGQLTIDSRPGGTRVSVRVPTECRSLDANRE